MSSLQQASLIPFGKNTMIVSPRQLYGEKSAHDARENVLRRMHGILETDLNYPFSGGVITISNLVMDIVQNPDVWGGDGVSLEIPFAYTGKEFSQAAGKDVVVYDVRQKKHFIKGVEYFIGASRSSPQLVPKLT